MSAARVPGLSDEQIATLSRLLAASLEADRSLADISASELLAFADGELARRAGQPPALPGLNQPPLAGSDLVSALSAAVARVQAQTTSTTKWAEVESILARALDVAAGCVYATSVGGLSRNVSVRLTQSRRARRASLAAIIWAESSEPTHLAIAAASRACLELPRHILVFVADPGRVDLAAIISPAHAPAPSSVLTVAYPDAVVVDNAADTAG